MNALRAGIWYFVSIFALGFVLGTLRVLIATPRIGETRAVLIESPLMLIASWFACRYFIERFHVDATIVSRITMGLYAFIFLIAAEAVLARYMFGQSMTEFIQHFYTLSGRVGLTAQILFGLFPALDLIMRRRA